MNQRLQGIGMTSLRTRSRLIDRLQAQGIDNQVLIEIMRNTPRHIFIDEALASRAYEDTALPIGHGQTISQPYIVAKMTELLIADKRPKKVLEIGTGRGYQTAILAQLIDQVYSVERIRALQQQAQQNLNDLELTNVHFKYSDGGWGWQEQAPYDAILVTAATPEIPDKLIAQMAMDSIMIIPIKRKDDQILHKVLRTRQGIQIEALEQVSFVPFLSGKQYV